MSLVVLERYTMFTEALVARSVLASAGIDALVAEEHHGVGDPLIHVAISGFRLCVPSGLVDDARDVLEAARELAITDPATAVASDPTPLPWTGAALAATMMIPEGGFLVDAVRRRRGLWRRALIGGLPFYLLLAVIIGLHVQRMTGCEPGTRHAQSEECLARSDRLP